MAKKSVKVSKGVNIGYGHYLIPALIAFVIAWFFSESVVLGLLVFIAVLIGNYIGFKVLQKK